MKPCPTGCGADAGRKLMCLDCWRLLPRQLQREVMAMLGRYKRQDALGLLTRRDCVALIEARDRAIASVRERLIKRELSA